MKTMDEIDDELRKAIDFINIVGHPNESSSIPEWVTYATIKTTIRTLLWVKGTDMNSVEQVIHGMLDV